MIARPGTTTHLVVFDVNVYLDAARLVGPPFDQVRFDDLAVQAATQPLPHRTDAAFDSLRALAVAQSGLFAQGEALEVWTSDHVDNLVELKAHQPSIGSRPEQRGLGWSADAAAGLVSDLVRELVLSRTGGASVGQVRVSYGSPPLSHEDGLVYRTAEAAGDQGRYYQRYCVTRDREFRTARLPGLIRVLYPHEWVALVRAARSQAAVRRMRPQADG